MSYLNLCPSYYPDDTYTQITVVGKAGPKASSFDAKLPLPNQLDYSSEFSWSTDTISLGASTMIDTAFSNVNSKNFTTKDGWNIADDVLKGIASGSAELAIESFRGLAKNKIDDKLTPITNKLGIDVNGDKLLKHGAKAAGYAYNPNEVLYFNGVSHRTFLLAFDIVPLSKRQAEDAATAIQQLRVLASPSFELEKTFFTYPSYFSTTIMVKGTKLLERPSFIIRSINTNLAPGGAMSWHEDGKPVSFTIQLDCMESSITTAENEKQRSFMGSQG